MRRTTKATAVAKINAENEIVKLIMVSESEVAKATRIAQIQALTSVLSVVGAVAVSKNRARHDATSKDSSTV